ncbi:MAG: YmaF family protein [Clostridia bacterium]|nr:YmaF family protein [Clostridia bacterium]
MSCNENRNNNSGREQRHVHEVVGSTQIEGCCSDAHNHRFATVSGEAIPTGCGDHVHEIRFRTDFTDGHFHEFRGRTGGAIPVGGGRHVHFVEAKTTQEDGHRHCFRVASLIEDPVGDCGD